MQKYFRLTEDRKSAFERFFLRFSLCVLVCFGGLFQKSFWLNAQTPVSEVERLRQERLKSSQGEFFPDQENLRSRISERSIKTPRSGNDLKKENQEVIVETLRGISLCKPGELLIPLHGITEGVGVRFRDRLTKRLFDFLWHPLTFADLEKISAEVEAYYLDEEGIQVQVVVPEQEVLAGVIRLDLVRTYVGSIQVQGLRWFSTDLLRKELGICEGESYNRLRLSKKIASMNQNSFIKMDAFISEEESKQKITIQAQDRFPIRFFAGYEDSGSDLLGDVRWLGGVSTGNVLGWGDQVDYQFLTTSDIEFLQGHSMSYRVPLPWQHRLRFSGSYSKIKGDFAEVDQIDLKGSGISGSGYYEVDLPSFKSFKHEISFGFEGKKSQSDLLIGGFIINKTSTEVAQFALKYEASYQDSWGVTQFDGAAYESPGGITGQNKDSSFRPSRRNAEANYQYATIRLERWTRLWWSFELHNEVFSQFASGNLIGGEQLGIGGWSTVRGYDEREVNADEGWWIRNEFWTPGYS